MNRYKRIAIMNATIKFLCGSLLFAMFASRAAADSLFNSYYNGKCYQFAITEKRQSSCPKWDLDKDANPPYPAAKALAQSRKLIADIPTSKEMFWELEDLALVDVSGGWAWRARYRLTFRGFGSGGSLMDCWILMDGTSVKPTITKRKER